MNALEPIQSGNLPANIEELARFVLVGREKLTSVRAEIRAINKLNLAEEVRTQKKEEALMLSEALLDAEVRLGELTKALPKSQGFASNGYNHSRQQCRKCDSQPIKNDSGVVFEKSTILKRPKLEVIQNLGFNPKQVERFEMLANNPDVVAQVKAEARENDDLPTRSRVLQLVKEKNRPDKQPAISGKEVNKLISAIVGVSNISTNPQVLKEWFSLLDDEEEIDFNISMIDDAIQRLQILKAFITKNRRDRYAVD